MDFDYQILKMTPQFYKEYDTIRFPELLSKESRAYTCLLIDLHYDYFICVPFRTEIRHKNAYKFRFSKRSKLHQSGLDYSKLLIITNTYYMASGNAVVDKDEYNETIDNINVIVENVNKYILGYINHRKEIKILKPKEFNRKYKYSSLKYFHRELGI